MNAFVVIREKLLLLTPEICKANSAFLHHLKKVALFITIDCQDYYLDLLVMIEKIIVEVRRLVSILLYKT